MAFIEKGQKIDIEQIKSRTRLTGQALAHKNKRDQELAEILSGEDERILLVIGPCSSDNEEAVLEYARRLSELQKKVADKIFIVMRVYTAKPRTNGDGYKGLVHQQILLKLLVLSMVCRQFVSCTTASLQRLV